jgi:hypothetical protein
VSRWAFDVGRVRRFAGFLSIVFSPARSARLAEIASNYLSHIAPRSKPFYTASPEPLLISAGGGYDAVLRLRVSGDLCDEWDADRLEQAVIQVSSSTDTGTTFTIALPKAQ